MWRPSDWSPLGLAADPTPGDPVIVRDGGQHYRQVAQALASSAATLRALNGGATTGSDSVTALLEDCGKVLEDVTKAHDRYQVAGDALVTYSYSLDRVQSTTVQALATARVAAEQAAADRRLAASYAASASAAAGSGLKTADADAAGWNARAAQANADAALQDQIVNTQKVVVSQAVADRDTAATLASSQIEEITAKDGLNDTWWDDWGAKVVAVIAKIAEVISMIAGILALLVCWIPVIGQALAAVLLVIAAISAIVAALANIALAATGEKSWTEALISVAFAVLSCVGLGGLRGALGALKAGAGLLKGGRLAAMGLKGLAAGTSKMIANGIKGIVRTAKGIFGKRGLPTVVFSRTKAPGLAANFDNAVAHGSPTILTRTDAANKALNRAAALRGQPRRPPGMSWDEYPFACTVQGGGFSRSGQAVHLRLVSTAEQSYQGGVLSTFFQNSNIAVGDSFRVVFIP